MSGVRPSLRTRRNDYPIWGRIYKVFSRQRIDLSHRGKSASSSFSCRRPADRLARGPFPWPAAGAGPPPGRRVGAVASTHAGLPYGRPLRKLAFSTHPSCTPKPSRISGSRACDGSPLSWSIGSMMTRSRWWRSTTRVAARVVAEPGLIWRYSGLGPRRRLAVPMVDRIGLRRRPGPSGRPANAGPAGGRGSWKMARHRISCDDTEFRRTSNSSPPWSGGDEWPAHGDSGRIIPR
jgi:hypothetical protein